MKFGPALAVSLCVLSVAGALAVESVDQQRERLKRVQAELEQKKKEKERSDRRARELRSEVDRISEELDGARRTMAETERRLADAERKRSAAEERLWNSRRTLGTWEEKLAAVLADQYRSRVVAVEGGFVERTYAAALLSEQVTGLSFAVENHAGVVALRDQLMEIEEDLRNLQSAKVRDERRIENARDRMTRLARTEEGRQAVLKRQMEDLHASARRFERMIQDLIEKERAARARRPKTKPSPAPSPSLAANRWRGRVGWPVDGPVVEKFGRTHHPELDTFVISNGVRLRPSASATVNAVAAGDVLFAGPFMNYGLMTLVSHTDGLHTIYAGLGNLLVEAGQSVSLGEALGRPGRDDQGRPQVYFEMRVDGEPVDPERWVK